MVDSSDYFGLAPGKIVGLKYASCRIRCEEVITDNKTGEPISLRCTALLEDEVGKPKSTIQWVAESKAVPVEVRLYNPLFVVDEPTEAGWESELNPESEVVCTSAVCDPSLLDKWNPKPDSEAHFQFERIGFFVVDKDSSVCGENDFKYVFNLTVPLKDAKPKDVTSDGATDKKSNGATSGAGRSRKEEQAKQLADKMARMAIKPEDMYRSGDQANLYSQYDADGVPTHDAAGEKLSKSKTKSLRKDWEKQKRLFDSNFAKNNA